jgi:photosystem II stability/assembly factor-like uncharacterized protein
MKFFRPVLFLLATTPGWAASAAPAPAPPAHEFYICASTTKNYLVGSVVTTINGVFRHETNGDWTHLGNNDVSVAALAFDPRDHNVYYAASINGCWRSLDGGKSSRCTTSWDVTEPKDVCVDPNAPDHVYLATPDGIAVSSNRGDTWVRMENGLPERGKYTQTIRVDRTRAGRVLAGCETGIYLTENGAQSWRRVFVTKDTIDDLQQSPSDPKLWLAVTQSAGALISRDGGVTWTAMSGPPKDKALYNITFDATNPRRFALCSWSVGVMTSEDGGATWTDRNAGLPGKKAGFRMDSDPPPHCVWRVGVDPDSGRLYASVIGEALYSSDDFGRTWKSEGLEGSAVSRFVFVPHVAK